jgi:WD40 repeat protein
VRRITTGWRLFLEHHGIGAKAREAMGFSRAPIFDVRLLGAMVAALIALPSLTGTEPEPRFARSRLDRDGIGIPFTSLAFSPTGDHVATTNAAGRVTLRTWVSGEQIERFLNCPGYARVAAFSPDGRSLAAAGIARGVYLWDLSSPTSQPATALPVPIRRAGRMMFSPDSRSLAVTTDLDGTILLWDLARGRERMVLHHPSPVASMAFSPDGQRLAAGGRDDRSILLWDLQTGDRRVLRENGPGHAVALAFSPDGALLASANLSERHVRLWDLDTWRECLVFAGHERFVNSIAFSPDGLLLATAGNDGMVGLWTVATGRRWVSLDGRATCLPTVMFSPDGRTLVLASGDDNGIRSWNLADLP